MRMRSIFIFLILFVVGFAPDAHASHFRFGHTTWRLVSVDTGGNVTVEFHSVQAWRASFVDWLGINTGDGNFIGTSGVTNIGTFSDLAGEQYTVREQFAQHTYSADDISSSGGVFFVTQSSCCRIGSLVNAGSASEVLNTVVDLNNGNTGSPASSLPIILQFAKDTVNTIPVPIADPDRDPLTCRMATSSESAIPSVAQVGPNQLSVSSDCQLSWDTTGATNGAKYAAQIVVEENNPGDNTQCPNSPGAANTGCGQVVLDFIIEIVDGDLPVCNSDKPVNNVAFVGVPFQVNFTGTDADDDSLTVFHLGLPSGSTLTPDSGTTQNDPFIATFDWTPQEADRGSAKAITVFYKDSVGLEGYCFLGIEVPENNPAECQVGGPYASSCQGPITQIALDGSSSSDPDGDDLSYFWSTDCPDSLFSDDSSSTPELLVPNPGTGQPIECEVTLTVYDGNDRIPCSAKVNVDECRDECNEVNLSNTILALDGNALSQSNFAKRMLRKLRRVKKYRELADQYADEIETLYLNSWTIAWSFDEVTNVCTQTAFCVSTDNANSVSSYDSNAQRLLEITTDAINKSKRKKRRRRRLIKRAKQRLEDSLEVSNDVPLVTNSCPS